MTGASLGKTLGGWGGKYAGTPTTGWLSIGGTGPAFGPGWANSGSTAEVGQVRKTGTTVKVRGSVVRAAPGGTTVFTLAAGMCPNRIIQRPCVINSLAGALQVDTGGLVSPISGYSTGQGMSFEFEFDVDEL